MEPNASFGQWLQRRRKQCDLTQDALAQQVNCAVGTIQKFEQEQRRPSQAIAERLAQVLGIAEDERAAFIRFARGAATARPPASP